MAKKPGTFRWRRVIVVGASVIAGAFFLWVIGRQLGANQTIADWQAERATTAKGIEDAAAIERRDAAAKIRRATPEAPPRSVSVTELFNAYRADPRAAQRTYDGGRLEVAGQVARVMGTPGEATIEFVSPQTGTTVAALIAREDADLISLVKPGAKISVLCESVTAVGAVPVLSDCRF